MPVHLDGCCSGLIPIPQSRAHNSLCLDPSLRWRSQLLSRVVIHFYLRPADNQTSCQHAVCVGTPYSNFTRSVRRYVPQPSELGECPNGLCYSLFCSVRASLSSSCKLARTLQSSVDRALQNRPIPRFFPHLNDHMSSGIGWR